MDLVLIVLALLASYSSSSSVYPQAEYVTLEIQAEDGHSHHNDVGGDVSAAILSSLAKNSAIQAKNAAHSQHSAAGQAAYSAKSGLASVASGAAKTAQAALVGRRALTSNLKRQLYEAKQRLQDELHLQRQTDAAAQAARDTAEQAQKQSDSLRAALAAAQSNAQDSAAASVEAANAAAAQKAMTIEARHKVWLLSARLHQAEGESRETEAAAWKAGEAARRAAQNAQKAQHAAQQWEGSDAVHFEHYF